MRIAFIMLYSWDFPSFVFLFGFIWHSFHFIASTDCIAPSLWPLPLPLALFLALPRPPSPSLSPSLPQDMVTAVLVFRETTGPSEVSRRAIDALSLVLGFALANLRCEGLYSLLEVSVSVLLS